MSKNNIDEVLNKIEKENIKPKSKEFFIVKNWLFIVLSLISFVFACIGSILNIIFLSRLDYEIVLTFPILQILKIVYPTVFWLSLVVGFGIITYIFFKNTQKGYKIERKYLYISISLILILFLSLGWFVEHKYNLTSNWVSYPILRDVSDPRYQIWNNSDEGRIAGEILDVDENEIVLSDVQEKEWTVDTSEAFVPKRVQLTKGEEVKVVGEITGEKTFKAERIMPWGQGRMGQMQENGNVGRSNR